MNRVLSRGLLAMLRRSWRAQRLFDITFEVEGIHVPIYRHMGFKNLDYRATQFQAFIKAAFALRPEGQAVDIGANLGCFLLNLIAIDRSKPYLGFEPLPEAAAYIRRIIVENRLASHNIIPIALRDRHGMISIRCNSECDVSATVTDNLRPPSMYSNKFFIASSTADTQLKKIPAIALIKLDVEGSELNVLHGMADTLETHRPPLLIEVMPYSYMFDCSYDKSYFGNLQESEARRVGEARRDNCRALENLFREREYTFFSSFPDGSSFPATTLDRGESKDKDMDFLVLPSETASSFMNEFHKVTASAV